MRIAVLSDQEDAGGAAIATGRLVAQMRALGHEVARIVAHSSGRASAITIELPRRLDTRIARRFLPAQPSEWISSKAVRRKLSEVLEGFQPDVINIHNLHSASRIGWTPSLAEVSRSYAPTVWTLHDMWSFTGRCAYSYDCTKFLTGCDATCPTPDEYPSLAPNRIRSAWDERKRVLTSSPDLIAVSPSEWMARKALSGLWFGHRVEVIPYGLPLDVFRPLDPNLSRREVGLSEADLVLMVCADQLDDRRKGLHLLTAALAEVKSERRIALLTVGHGHISVPPSIEIKSMGYVQNDEIKAMAYSASDLFIHPALSDNFPNTVAEALACGVPVLGFAQGGLPEMITSSELGWLVDDMSSDALAVRLNETLRGLPTSTDSRQHRRSVAETRFNPRTPAVAYLRLFRELVAEREAKVLGASR